MDINEENIGKHMCVCVCIIGEIFITALNVSAIYSLSFETSFNYISMIYQLYLAQLISLYKEISCGSVISTLLVNRHQVNVETAVQQRRNNERRLRVREFSAAAADYSFTSRTSLR